MRTMTLAIALSLAAHAYPAVASPAGPPRETIPSSPSGLWVSKPPGGGVSISNVYSPGATPYVPKTKISTIQTRGASNPAAQPSERPSPSQTSVDQGARAAAISEARRRLERAMAAVESGIEPMEGERTGNANGSSRLNERYHARMESLNAEVEAARKALSDAESSSR